MNETTKPTERTIYIRRGETLAVECLEDSLTGKKYFLVRDTNGMTVIADEIKAGDAVFTADESKRMFDPDSLEEQVYNCIQDALASEKHWGIENGNLAGFGTVRYIGMKALKAQVNQFLGMGDYAGLSVRTISKICRAIGFRSARTADGWVVLLEEQDLEIAGRRFNGSGAPGKNAFAGNG